MTSSAQRDQCLVILVKVVVENCSVEERTAALALPFSILQLSLVCSGHFITLEGVRHVFLNIKAPEPPQPTG